MTSLAAQAFRPATALVPLLLVAACGGQAATKSGGAVDHVQLTVAAATPNSLTGETTDHLVAAAAASKGLSLRRTPDVAGGDGSTTVIEQVRDGKVDVGVLATRVLDLYGVTSMQALNAPFVFQSPEQAIALVRDPVADEMLAGVSKAGVVAVGLAYDQLREPIGYGRRFLRPADIKGQAILSRPSAAMAKTLEAVGATADLANGTAQADAINAKRVSGYEASVERPIGPVIGPADRPSTITANLHLAARVNVVVVNKKVWTGLSDEQQKALRAAARETRDWAAGQARSLRDAAADFCAKGLGDVALADGAALVEWQRAVQPVVSQLADRDPVTARALTRLRAIVATHPLTAAPVACRSAARPGSTTQAGGAGRMPGIWRLNVDGDKLAAAGASAQDVALNRGVWTFTFHADRSYEYVEPRGRTCSGTFGVTGDQLAMDEQGADCDGRWRFTTQRSGDNLSLTPSAEMVASWAPMRAFFSNGLVRVGDASP
jgi:TRAP-type C4-dicarboxylate transport system substrate-binding protein